MGPMGNAYTLNWPCASSSWLAGSCSQLFLQLMPLWISGVQGLRASGSYALEAL